ncbi:hypothetical protein JQ616_02315 [Bradyrhizobium tropiciagri]|uniref:hypothetical protein n=1 Tax=Bradyrhizobium tropiciagri TaxID=312253 RepID=UPI001BAE3C7D|nr:hypothetical protein [Bradyrhizobium tropiciagri]MBR0893769.1 hypothetical protein [Bradyrhizobium tropiciagri]
MNPTIEPAPSHLKPVTWSTWFAWVLVSGLTSVFTVLSATAIGKPVSRSAEHRELIMSGLLAAVVIAALAPPLIQGIVLKRVVPRLSITVWSLGTLLSCALWLGTALHASIRGPLAIGFEAEFRLQRAALVERVHHTLIASRILDLPWGSFLASTIVISVLTSLIPACVLGIASGRRRTMLTCLGASVVATVVSAIAAQLYHMTIAAPFSDQWALNGQPWPRRLQVLADRFGAGAIWGATTAIFAVLMTRDLAHTAARRDHVFALHRAGGIAAALIAPLPLAMLAPLAAYCLRP